jgi:cyclohexanecarboxyl-CoA dehydrogenase
MTAALTEEQHAIKDVAQRFAHDRIAPGFMQREHEQKIDCALIREMGALGLIGVDLPDRFGGLGAPSVTAGVIMEAIGYADLNVAYVQLLASLNGQIIARHASDSLAQAWIPRIVSGDVVCALALTEPRGGSDAANLTVSARRSGDS